MAKAAKTKKTIVESKKGSSISSTHEVATIVSLTSGINTLKVEVERRFRHAKYEKQLKRHKKFLVEIKEELKSELKVGDDIMVSWGSPVSKNKKLRFVKLAGK